MYSPHSNSNPKSRVKYIGFKELKLNPGKGRALSDQIIFWLVADTPL